MPTSEDRGHIELENDEIRYTSATYPEWTIRVDNLRVMGEATNQNGPFSDDYFLCFATGPEMWKEAPFYATGRNTLLTALGERLGATFQLRLASSTDFASRILWPLEFAERPMFRYQDAPPKTMIGRLSGSRESQQTYTDHALAAIDK